MVELTTWLGLSYAVWLAAVPFAWLTFPNLHSRGLGFARPIGLISIGTAVWVSSLTGLTPSIGPTWWFVTVMIGVAGWGYLMFAKRGQVVGFARDRWRDVLAAEAAFLIFFVLIVALKANDPDIAGTEKPMDLMMLNAVVSDKFAPPQDLWLSGFDIAYYYFGYWMFGGISQMGGIPTSIAYNLSLALIAGMSAGAIMSLVSDLIKRDRGRYRVAVASGAVAVVALLVMSNLNGLWEMLTVFGIGGSGFYEWLSVKGVDTSEIGNGWRPTGFWWWWASSRVINSFGPRGEQLDFTIQEFPFFSFLLGDLHPHVMSIPFLLVAVGMAANLLWSKVRWSWRWVVSNKLTSLCLVLIVGTAGFINTWDLIIVVPLLGLALLLKVYRENRTRFAAAAVATVLPYLALCIVAAVLFSNFYFFTLHSQVGFPPVAPTRHGTRLVQFLTVWVPLLLLVAPFLYVYLAQGLRRTKLPEGNSGRVMPPMQVWFAPTAICVFVYIAWFVTHLVFNQDARWIHVIERVPVSFPLALGVVCLSGTLLLRARRGASDAAQICLALALMSCFLLYFAEHFYALDFFGTRMNTVFKLYYQVWILLAVVAGYSVFRWVRAHSTLSANRLTLSRIGAVVVSATFAASLYYAIAASDTKMAESGTPTTLNGLAFMETRSGDDLAAIKWIGANLGEGDVLVESVGGSYSDHGRFSGFSGVPAVLGWSGHERQWRGGTEGWIEREDDVQRIYTSEDLDDVRALFNKYGVTHIVVGTLEREKYTEIDATKFNMLGSVVYSNASVDVYEIRR